MKAVEEEVVKNLSDRLSWQGLIGQDGQTDGTSCAKKFQFRKKALRKTVCSIPLSMSFCAHLTHLSVRFRYLSYVSSVITASAADGGGGALGGQVARSRGWQVPLSMSVQQECSSCAFA
jgi:hypothetical protein